MLVAPGLDVTVKADVSLLSRPVFERLGFIRVQVDHSVREFVCSEPCSERWLRLAEYLPGTGQSFQGNPPEPRLE